MSYNSMNLSAEVAIPADSSVSLDTGTEEEAAAIMGTAIYTRISNDREGMALGVERQRKDCEALAEKLGWAEPELYEDNDITGSGKKVRPAWERLLADIAAGRVDRVVSYSAQRLTRDMDGDLPRIFELARAHRDLSFPTVASGTLNPHTADGRMMWRIQASVDTSYVEKGSELIRRKMLANADEGKPHGGSRAFGYKAGGLEVEPGEARVIRETYERLVADENLYEILGDLKDRGVRGTGFGSPDSGKRWSPPAPLTRWAVQKWFTNPRYAGVRVHQGQPYGLAQWPAILTPEEQENGRALLDAHARTRTLSDRTHPLKGRVVCGLCGRYMTISYLAKTDELTFRCNTKEGRHASVAANRLSEWVALQSANRTAPKVVRVVIQPGAGPTPLERRVAVEWGPGTQLLPGRPEVAPEPLRRKLAERGRCQHPDGCPLPEYNLKTHLCEMHYQRLWKTGLIGPAGLMHQERGAKRCVAKGILANGKRWHCMNMDEGHAFTRGLCTGHYQQLKRDQPLRPLRKRKRARVSPEELAERNEKISEALRESWARRKGA